MTSADGRRLDVAVVVVTYNSERHIESLLDSLPSALGDLSSTTVVVDNGSTDSTRAILAERSDCVVVHSTNVGYAAGVNLGVRRAQPADSILVLNPDTTLDPGAVPAMRAVLDRPRVGIVAPLTLEADGRLSPTIRREPTLPRIVGLSFTGLAAFTERVEDPRAYGHEHPVDWAVGSVLLVSARCYDALGGLDESYFLYSEETEFCLRARDQGWLTVFTPTARVMHIGGGSGESQRTHTMQSLNQLRLYRRRKGPLRAWPYYGFTVLREVRWALRGVPFARGTIRALLRPHLRPAELDCGPGLLPR